MTTIPVGALVRDRELPELGPGRVVAELKGGASRIVFEHKDEIRDVDLKRVDVVRLPLIPGTKVHIRSGRFGDEETEEGVVLDAELPDTPAELCDYVVEMEDEKRTVSEAELFPQPPPSTAPVDQFDSLFWRGPFRFFARWGMHRTTSRLYEDSEGLPALIGARIEPQPHQLRAVRSALWSPQTRFILSDPSPRDRLIEAGLIAQCLTAENPDLRTLILTPGLRSREWQNQMYLRFGGREYVRVTESRVAGLEFHQLAEVFQNDRMVVSVDLVEHNRDAQTMLAGEGWDLLIVAGAHRLEAGSEAYGFARELSGLVDTSIVLSPMPRSADATDLTRLFALVRPDEYEPDDSDEVEAYIEEKSDLWDALLESLDAGADELDESDLEEIAQFWEDSTVDDPVIERYRASLGEGDGDVLEDLLEYVQSFHGFADLAVRTPRSALKSAGIEWPERSVEIVEYEADPEEQGVLDHLEDLPVPDEPDATQKAMRTAYVRRFWETPERFVELLQERGEALEKGAGSAESDTSLLDRLVLSPDQSEMDAIWHRIVERAAPLPDEKQWIGKALGVTQGWQNAVGRSTARFEAANEWIEEHLDEDDENKVLVYSESRRHAEAFHSHLLGTLGDGAVELYHGELPETLLNEAAVRFRQEEDCRALVVDELGAEGRRLDPATAIVHLDQPWSPERLEARIARIDGARREKDVRSVVLQGPGDVERGLVELYADILGLYDEQAGPIAWDFPQLERALIDAVGGRGAEGLSELHEEWTQKVQADAAPEARAFQASIDPRPGQLEDVTEFSELLDFVDGLDDALPVRHWARMIGIDDHRVRPGVYDFKWHWSSVRRDLPGFDIPEGDDPAEWEDEDTVRYLSGTFSRQHALDDESLQFFGPGHLLIDALIKDAMGPTDGRATVFARRLGSQHRGKVVAVIVVQCDLNEESWGELEPPEGLIQRTHRRFWPESATAMVEIDLKGSREPKVVDDADLERRLEESYEGPEADQKIEYETLVRAIEDAARFREVLRDAIETGLDDLRDEREFLVEDAADRLEEDFKSELDYWKGVESRTDSDEKRAEAERQIELRERLVESVRDYAMEVDALALVVGGTPEALLR